MKVITTRIVKPIAMAMDLTELSIRRCLILLAVLLLCTSAAHAQEENIYLIKIFDCTYKPVERSQTGFRVRGVKGIITALHGVADCRKITASSRKGLFLDEPLTVVKIDADHDMALLSSPQLERAESEGLDVARNVAWDSLGTVKVYGHPYGIGNLETTLSLRNPPLTQLKELIPPPLLSTLKERRSPNHLVNVLNLQGNLLPGHSGAPVLDSRARVVGVANGGLKEGFAGISWAMPFKDIDWDNVGSGSRLRTLAQLDPNLLFTADTLPAMLSDDVDRDFCGQLSRVIAESRTGFIALAGNPTDEAKAGVFNSKIKIPGANYGFVRPNISVIYPMYRTDKIGQVEARYYDLAAKVSVCFQDWKHKEKSITGYKRYMFRENDKSTMIEISYNLEPNKNNQHTLLLEVYAAGISVIEVLWK
jgi:trypsin-like peptidase